MIKVRSPVGSFVTELIRQDGEIVKHGDQILRLDNEDERQEIARLTKFKLLSEESVRQLTGVSAKKKREVLTLSRDVANSYQKYLEFAHMINYEAVQIGQKHPVDLKQVEAELAEANAKLSKAEIMIVLFDENMQHNLKLAQLSVEHAEGELKFANRKLGETVILSPATGTLQLRVNRGSYVKQGGVLAQIVP